LANLGPDTNKLPKDIAAARNQVAADCKCLQLVVPMIHYDLVILI
jgi:hypothetical protein